MGANAVISRDFWWVLVLLVLHAALSLWAGPLYCASDDLVYAQLAEAVRTGTFHLTPSHFANRFGVFVPQAIVFSWFGITPYSTVAWDFLAGQMTLLWLFLALHRIFGLQPAFLATFLLASNPLWIQESVALGPDVPVTFFTTATLLTLWQMSRTDHINTPAWRALQVVGLLLAGILTKLTALWVLPPLLFFLWNDGVQGRHRPFWIWVGGWLLLAIGGYLLAYSLVAGSPWHHFTVVDRAGVLSPDKWSYAGKTLAELLARVTYQPLVMFLDTPALLVPMVLSSPVLLGWYASQGENRQDLRFWRITTLFVLLMYWFGTRSYSVYNPMHLMPRTWLPLLPLLCILSGLVLDRILRIQPVGLHPAGRGMALGLGGVFGVLSLISWWTHRWKLPLLMSVVAMGVPWFMAWTEAKLGIPSRNGGWWRVVVMIFILLFFPVLMTYRGYLGKQPHQITERLIVDRYLRFADSPVIVDTDARNVESLSYYLQFQMPPQVCLRVIGSAVDPCAHLSPTARQLVFQRQTQRNREAWEQSLLQQSAQDGWCLLEGGNGVFLFDKKGCTG